MAFDKNYIELSTISIASILNTSNNNTYTHFHILCLDFNFKDKRKIIQLKRINKNVEFTFYNAKQAEYDFGERAKMEWRGVGNYAKILATEIVNNTNKILMIDSGDTIAQKDISEIFFYDINDNYFGLTLDINTGRLKTNSDFFFQISFILIQEFALLI
jgi:lipopolysaccharide biosynthesis glycosyltransferase